jgi:hypothetical protein
MRNDTAYYRADVQGLNPETPLPVR